MVNELKGAVVARYGTIAAFAKVLKWDRKKASRIVNYIQNPTVDDMYAMAEALNVRDCATFTRLFLPKLTTMWE